MAKYKTVSSRIELESQFYDIAVDHLEKSSKRKDVEDGHIIAVVMSCFCLEAFINSEIEDFELPEELKYIKLETKWLLAPKLLNPKVGMGKKANFNEKKGPFKFFKKLIGLRNYIAHHKAKLNERVMEVEYINYRNAKLSVKTVNRMMNKYHKIIGMRNGVAWLNGRYNWGGDAVRQAHRLFEPEPSFDTEPSLDPEISGPKGRTKCRAEGLSKVEGNSAPTRISLCRDRSLDLSDGQT
jgi:hypothetical protein